MALLLRDHYRGLEVPKRKQKMEVAFYAPSGQRGWGLGGGKWRMDFGFACSVTQSCLTLCNPTDFSLLGSSVHGILQARILEWVAVPFSRGSSRPRDRVSCIAARFFTI